MRFVIVLVGSFWPLIHCFSTTPQPRFQPPHPFHPFLSLVMALQGFCNHLNNITNKTQSIFKDHRVWSSGVFEVTASSEEGCLNTLRLFSLGGELPLIFFLFLFEEIATKLKREISKVPIVLGKCSKVPTLFNKISKVPVLLIKISILPRTI